MPMVRIFLELSVFVVFFHKVRTPIKSNNKNATNRTNHKGKLPLTF